LEITSLNDGPIQEDSAKLDSVLERGDCLYGCGYIVGIPPKASMARGYVTTPTENDISIENDSSDTKPFILNIVRQRIPSLRHIYLKYLKRVRDKKPSFKGTIVLKLEIGEPLEISASQTCRINHDFIYIPRKQIVF
jgi:hypothetical protein